NAIQHNRPGGSVRVAVHAEAGGAILSVTDTGRGILPEDLPHIFERFYRAEKSRAGGQGHSGLGLAITQAIVDAHGGKIDVTSKPGEGSTFVLRLRSEIPFDRAPHLGQSKSL
ncbi:MAG: sensor histidine kinase, partial [Verrucomicrobiae bacterium]